MVRADGLLLYTLLSANMKLGDYALDPDVLASFAY
jgi:hypothetical protein